MNTIRTVSKIVVDLFVLQIKPTQTTGKFPSLRDIFSRPSDKFIIFFFHTSVKNIITFPKFPPWLWGLIKLNTGLLKYDKHETNPKVTTHINFTEIFRLDLLVSNIIIYTDVSKSTELVRVAIIFNRKPLPYINSLQKSVYSRHETANNILILSDSFSGLLALKNPTTDK